jgi:hypothetical protein
MMSLLTIRSGNTKGGSINVPLTSCLTGLDKPVLQIKTKIVSSHTADSKPVKQEINGTVILLPLVFPGQINQNCLQGLTKTKNIFLLFFQKIKFYQGDIKGEGA